MNFDTSHKNEEICQVNSKRTLTDVKNINPKIYVL